MRKNFLPIDRIILRMGYEDSENFHRYEEFENLYLPMHYRNVLNELHPYAAYFLKEAPFVLFFDKVINEDISFKSICGKVWNAQIPVIVFCDESTVKIYNGLSLNLTDHMLKHLKTNVPDDCDENSDFSYWKISNPCFWEQYARSYSGERLNQSLLENISYLTDQLKNKYHISFATKLVLRLIFIRYLIDRGIDLDYDGFSTDIEKSKAEFLRLVKNKTDIYDLFSHLKTKFNGNLFELGTELDCLEFKDEVFELLYNFFSGKEEMNSGQLSLFNLYDFNIIPVEVISNIYEILLGREARNRDNAFYTPNYLVEYILDKTVTKTLKEKKTFVLLDPACGSGVFLVDSYRRIIQENLGEKGYCDNDTVLKKLLTDNIYGIDINEEAIDVTIFSLYLTILDYKDPKTLSKFTLPNLKGKNLYVSDFFDEKKLKPLLERKITFDYIIGNPPWGNIKDGLHSSYCEKNGYSNMQQNNEICRSFVFRAKDFCSKDTICCFVLHSKILYNKKKPAVRFRKYILKNTEIQEILELSSVRKLVFEHADAPAAVISFKYINNDNLKHTFTYVSVKPNIFFELFHVFCIEKRDVKFVPQFLLFTYDWAWKTIVYGTSYDLKIIMELKKKYSTLGQALSEQNPKVIMGAGVEYQDGDQRDASHLRGRRMLDSKKGVEHFFINESFTLTFSKDKVHRPRDRRLFDAPFVLIPKGIDCENYKIKAAYSSESFVANTAMYIVKGFDEQKKLLLNIVGLLNSSLYAYLNLLLGSSVGIEREQRFMEEVLTFPYVFSKEIVEKVDSIQTMLRNKNENPLFGYNSDSDVEQLDEMILQEFKLEKNNFIDYMLNIQIPELTKKNVSQIYRRVSIKELEEYGDIFVRQFSMIYKQSDKYVSTVLYPSVRNDYAAFELHISNSKPSVITVVKETDGNKNLFSGFSVHEYNDKFYQVRDVIYFGKDSFFIIKPNFYKNWHPAVAEMDLSDVMAQIMTSM